MKKKVYSAVGLAHIQLDGILERHRRQAAVVGIDVGKLSAFVVVRWGGDDFERPWVVNNPRQVQDLAAVLVQLKSNGPMQVAMESTGTYGDALRQALSDAAIELHLVSGKRAHDYAEVFDGVPSQHDGKDAAVVAELCALGKSMPWSIAKQTDAEQQIGLLVDQMQAALRIKIQWLGRLEALVARHWPEACSGLKLGGGTMLRALSGYGGPQAIAADEQARQQLLSWGHGKVSAARVDEIIASARATQGMSQSAVDVQRVKWCAAEALARRLELRQYRRQLRQLGEEHPVIKLQGKVIGVASAGVLWRHLGDPRRYHCAGAYRKAMGLNLIERSSGMHQGELKISKRGPGPVRRTLHLASLRLIQDQKKVQRWYQRKLKIRNTGKQAVIMALSRKLALALWSIVHHQQPFDIDRLLGRPLQANRKLETRQSSAGQKRNASEQSNTARGGQLQRQSRRKGKPMTAGT